ncbi:HNH endonuclease [Streptomyces phage Endor1]|uniref:HNH endonuclease n=1 Tax=Streptomyces phage Endor1 TaxID=2740181 RepID=A0A7G4AWX1_9CAUD|nr:HNH endonuclease [Streptomyces phage Endor1]QMP84511.1 HNH endonuclease [Streptomyces phage Endor1]
MRCSVVNSQNVQCDRETKAQSGLCSAHSYRFRRYGDVQADTPIRQYNLKGPRPIVQYEGANETERFWARVVEDEGHWLWAGSMSSGDSGQALFGGYTLPARRIAYVLKYGEIPDEVRVYQTCTTWSCVKHTEARYSDGTVFVPESEEMAA